MATKKKVVKGEDLLESAYKQIAAESASVLVEHLKTTGVEVSKDFTNTIESEVYYGLIMKVE